MKTLAKTVFATVLSVVVLTSSAMTTLAADSTEVVTVKNNFNKIWVSGNVKIVLTQGKKEGVSVDNQFNPEKTSISSVGQTLYVNTTETEQVTILVSVKDLQRIQAAGNAEVVTANKLDVKYLQVFLSQSAKAKINTRAGSLYTVINDDAKLKMSGLAGEYTLVASNMKNVKYADFISFDKGQNGSEILLNGNRVAASK